MSVHHMIGTHPAALSAAAHLVLTHAEDGPAAAPLLANAWAVLSQAVGTGNARAAIIARAEKETPGRGTERADAALTLAGVTDPAALPVTVRLLVEITVTDPAAWANEYCVGAAEVPGDVLEYFRAGLADIVPDHLAGFTKASAVTPVPGR